jgi:hypothetical protein
MTMRGGGRGGGRRGALRGRQRALLRRLLAGNTVTSVGGPVDAGTIATTGASSSALALVSVGSLALGTAGSGVTAVALRRIGVLAPATTGVGSDAIDRIKVGVLSPASLGRSSVAIVLTELGSLSALTAGRATFAAQMVEIGVLAPATSGVSATQATLSAIRTSAMATAGASADAVQLLGSHGLLSVGTAGSSTLDLAFDGSAEGTPDAPGLGGYGSARSAEGREHDHDPTEPGVLPFRLATRGASALEVGLGAHRPKPSPARPLARADDALEDWATILLLLDEAA